MLPSGAEKHRGSRAPRTVAGTRAAFSSPSLQCPRPGAEPDGFLLWGMLGKTQAFCPGARTPPGYPPRPRPRPDSPPPRRWVWAHTPQGSRSDHASAPSRCRLLGGPPEPHSDRWYRWPCCPGVSSARLSRPDPQLHWGRFSGDPEGNSPGTQGWRISRDPGYWPWSTSTVHGFRPGFSLARSGSPLSNTPATLPRPLSPTKTISCQSIRPASNSGGKVSSTEMFLRKYMHQKVHSSMISDSKEMRNDPSAHR